MTSLCYTCPQQVSTPICTSYNLFATPSKERLQPLNFCKETLYRLLPLEGKRARDMFAKVNLEDLNARSTFKWSLQARDGYVVGKKCFEGGGRVEIKMHRAVMENANAVADVPGLVIDHRNRDRLDCRRSNLRFATYLQNAYNRSKNRGQKGFIGVERSPKTPDFYELNISYRPEENIKRVFRICGYTSSEEAARARDALARLYHGEFANANFPGTEARDYKAELQRLKTVNPEATFSVKVANVSSSKKTQTPTPEQYKTSRFLGVTLIQNRRNGTRPWRARFGRLNLGTHSTEVEAALAVDEAREAQGEPRVNFVDREKAAIAVREARGPEVKPVRVPFKEVGVRRVIWLT